MRKIVYTPLLVLEVPPNVLAYIDIREVIPIRAGARIEEPFEYEIGDPPADRFDLEWYLTPPPAPNEQYTNDPRREVRSRLEYIESQRRGEMPSSQDFVSGLPTYEISPAVPQYDTGRQKGSLKIYAPEVLPYKVLYPKLSIIGQVSEKSESIELDCISEELSTPERNPYEPARPVWEK